MTDDEEFTDIVELLRSDDRHEYCSDAAKEIERLRADNKRLRDRMEKVADVLYDKGELDTWAAIRNALWQDGE